MVDSPCIAVTDSHFNGFFKSKSCIRARQRQVQQSRADTL